MTNRYIKPIRINMTKFEIGLARDGSRIDALALLKKVLKFIDGDKALPQPLKGHFTIALKSIIGGTDANRALLLTTRQGSDPAGAHRRYAIARIYRVMKNKGHSVSEIITALNELGFDIKERRAQDIHKEFKTILDHEEIEGIIPPRQLRTRK